MRKCTLADFCFTETDDECKDEKRIKFWTDWQGFSTVCVDKDAEGFKPLKVLGDPSSMISRKIIFNVQQCNPDNRMKGNKPCKTPK